MDPFQDEEEKRKHLGSRLRQFRKSGGKSEELSPGRGLYLVGSLGFLIVLCIGLGLGVGVVLDRRWHTEPWLALIGVFLGLVLALVASYDLIRSALRGKK